MTMNKEVLLSIADHLKAVASEIEKLTEESMLIEKPKSAPELNKTEAKKEQKISLEDVRAVLADKSRKGHRAEVKELLTKHGVERLSDINPSEYETLIEEARGIADA